MPLCLWPTRQTPDSKKEEFRKYLEKSGVVDALTKVLVGLYEEGDKPSNAVDYIKRFMGAPTGVDIEALRAENEELKKKNAELIKTIEELNKRVRLCVLVSCRVRMLVSHSPRGVAMVSTHAQLTTEDDDEEAS